MPEIDDRVDGGTTYLQHPLYREAMRQMADGNDTGATETLERLAEVYPEEHAIRELLLRLQLRTSFGTPNYIPKEPTPAKPILRNVVMLMLAVTLCLVAVTGFTVVKSRYYDPIVLAEQRQAELTQRYEKGERLLRGGDLIEARLVFEGLLAELPDDPRILEALQLIDQRQAWQDLYVSGVAAKERDDCPAALDLLFQVPEASPRYDDAQRLIEECREALDLEAIWLEAQGLIQAGDLDGAISILESIQRIDLEYRRGQVEEQLYQLYAVRVRPLLDSACGNADRLRQAIGYMDGALKLQPANREWIEEKRLAVAFLAGQEAFDRGDWDAAIKAWEPVYRARRDYQCGVLQRRLDQAYPQAARQLLSEANGSAVPLSQALVYVEKASTLEPENPEWQEDLRLVTIYLAGLDAFSQDNWNLAILSWGPLYAERSDYQNGALEEKLRQACANSPQPDQTLCQQLAE